MPKGNFRPGDVVVNINGSATQPNKKYAELIVSWNFDPGSIDKYKRSKLTCFLAPGTEPNYFVLDTDYTSYSIVWSCRETSEESFKGDHIFLEEQIKVKCLQKQSTY